MKRIISLLLVCMMFFTAFAAAAEEFVEEIDLYGADLPLYSEIDEALLMETDVKDELERRVIEAWTNLDDKIDISDLEIAKDDIVALYVLLIFENPLFYYIEKRVSGATVAGKPYMDYITPHYLQTDKKAIEETWAEIDKATEEILLYISPDMTDFEKVMAVHDYMVFRYDYDISDFDQTMLIILDKSGVCAAYAEAFLHVMNVIGIECSVVRSNDMGHIWNIVKLDNEWYHIDVTWDDLMLNRVTAVNHEHALLSTDGIIQKGHHGLDMAGYTATSTLYDDAPWHVGEGAIVSVDGIMYYVDGNNLVDENGNVIYEELDGGDNWWDVAKNMGVEATILAGLCEINDVLYFNTDEALYAYNPATKELKTVYEGYGICGMFADGNKIKFDLYDVSTGGFLLEELKIADIELSKPYYEDGKAVVRLYNDCDEPVWVISKGDAYQIEKITQKGVNTIKFDNGENQVIYVWKNSLEPFFEKKVVK